MVFRELGMYGATPRRGQLTLIAAAPGGGKSALATFLAICMETEYDYDPVPTLYFSADSDVATFGIRAGAIALESVLLSEVEQLILNKDERTLEVLEKKSDHIWVSFDGGPSCKSISDEVEAYATVNGDYPWMIVVDNLMDVNSGFPGREGDDAVLDFLKQLALRTGSAVIVLCHVTGEYTDGCVPIPRSGLMNKIDKRPRLILTLYNHDVNVLGVCIVKNNNGPQDAEGNLRVLIPWIKEKMYFGRGR